MYGEITPIADAGHVNAYLTLNIRGRRSRTDPADKDPNMSGALEVARAEDAYFARAGQFVGPLHGIPFAIKDNYDTADMRTTAGAVAGLDGKSECFALYDFSRAREFGKIVQ